MCNAQERSAPCLFSSMLTAGIDHPQSKISTAEAMLGALACSPTMNDSSGLRRKADREFLCNARHERLHSAAEAQLQRAHRVIKAQRSVRLQFLAHRFCTGLLVKWVPPGPENIGVGQPAIKACSGVYMKLRC